MHTLIHLLIAILIAFILGLAALPLSVFLLASILIDIDHILEIKYIKKVKKKFIFNPLKSNYETLQRSLHLFHTFEIITLLLIISIFIPIVFYISLAFIIHLLIDAIGNLMNKNYKNKNWIKYWFLFYYIKNKSLFNKEKILRQ